MGSASLQVLCQGVVGQAAVTAARKGRKEGQFSTPRANTCMAPRCTCTAASAQPARPSLDPAWQSLTMHTMTAARQISTVPRPRAAAPG